MDLIPSDPFFANTSNTILYPEDLTLCAREALRAVTIGDVELLRGVIADTAHVPSLDEPRDSVSGVTALHVAITTNNLQVTVLDPGPHPHDANSCSRP